MMYNSKMAMAVKVGGKVLREQDDAVMIPFGAEYSLTFKNLSSLRALVRVWIDGAEATEGTSLIAPANSSIDLERFIKNGNTEAGNAFKFIERTAAVSNHRGNKVDDGLIRVEFEFEQEKLPIKPINLQDYWKTQTIYNSPWRATPWPGNDNGPWLGAVGGSICGVSSAQYSATDAAIKGALAQNVTNTVSANALRSKTAEVGITVPGGVSDQKFVKGAWFATDGVKHTMVMRVLGEVAGQEVIEAVTVKHKPKCTTCGKVNKATAKYCVECGTGLQLV